MIEEFPVNPEPMNPDPLEDPGQQEPSQPNPYTALSEPVSQPSPALAEEIESTDSKPEEVDLLASVLFRGVEAHQDRLKSKEITGDQVVDYFIGAVVALGEIKDSYGDTQSAKEVLDDIAKHSVVYKPDPNSSETEVAKLSLDTFTRSNGLKHAVWRLGQDEATSSLLPSINNRLGSAGDYAPIVFTSTDQVRGYLDILSVKAKLPKNDWEEPVVSEMLSDGKFELEAIGAAIDQARELGADMTLLAMSSNNIKNLLGYKRV